MQCPGDIDLPLAFPSRLARRGLLVRPDAARNEHPLAHQAGFAAALRFGRHIILRKCDIGAKKRGRLTSAPFARCAHLNSG